MRFVLILALLFVALFAVDVSAAGRQGLRGRRQQRDEVRRLEAKLREQQLRELKLRQELRRQQFRNDFRHSQQFRSRGTTLQFRF